MNQNVYEAYQNIKEEIINIRREIHKNPEIGMDTYKTARLVSTVLRKYGIEHKVVEDVAVIAEIHGEKEKSDHMIMLRADMDALTIQEETGLEYCSKDEGKMHACGHDLHTSTLLASAVILNQMRNEFSGTIRFLFQPAEENGEGAAFLIRHGALNHVEMGFGIHVDPLRPIGTLSYREGASMASVGYFEIRIKGKSSHGAAPHKGRDALVAASSLVMNLQTLVSRHFDPAKPLLVTVGQLHAGSAYNIIAGNAYLEGTVRCFDEEIRLAVPAAMETIIKGICDSYECDYELNYIQSEKVTYNHAEAIKAVNTAAEKVFEKENIYQDELRMIGEDFSEYGYIIPCAFVHLGADGGYPLHSAKVCFNEDAITYGVQIEVQFALEALNQLNR